MEALGVNFLTNWGDPTINFYLTRLNEVNCKVYGYAWNVKCHKLKLQKPLKC